MIGALFILGGAAGAIVRHLVNQIGLTWIGTLALNVVGAFALGLLVAADVSDDMTTVVGIGLFGTLTTFSTFSLEVVEAPRRQRVLIVSATIVLGMGAAALGHAAA